MTNKEFIESITLEGEEWRDVVGYEGCYMVSNFGRVAMVRTSFKYMKNGKMFFKNCNQHICSTSISPSTHYRRMTFIMDGKKDTQLLHRVVATAFIPNPNNYRCIDHKDDNPQNNYACNLQWCTHKFNNSKEHHRKFGSAAKKGRIDPKRKPLVILKNGEYIKTYNSMFESNSDGHINSAILRVLRGELKTHHGFQWMYLSDYKTLVSKSKND